MCKLHFNNEFIRLQTDDRGVFNCTLSEQYEMVANAFGLSREELKYLAKKSIDYIFADENVKNQLKQLH